MCSRDFALRTVPKRPETVTGMYELLKECACPTTPQRFTLSHSKHPGETHVRPCTAPGCTFGHDRSTADADEAKLQQTLDELAADTSNSGKAKLSRFRMNHAHAHGQVQPGRFGKPFLKHDIGTRQIIDPLHHAQLNTAKAVPWKHGILNNSSDDAREAISEKLREWKHPLDTRRKDNNRVRRDKWFTGERFASFIKGERGSPGGPIAIAALV